MTLFAQKVVPALLDRYLAKRGYEGQQTDEPEVSRPDNLDRPVPGDFAAHGRFDDCAEDRALRIPTIV